MTIEERAEQIADSIVVKLTWHYQPSDIPIEGNVMASGDDEEDRKAEQAIRESLERGDDAAWFDAECRAEYAGVTASAYLGACSYASFDEFEAEDPGYASDMRQEAIESLATRLAEIESSLKSNEGK